MLARSAIQKGKDLENYVADQLKIKGLDQKAVRAAGSGNGTREKADINTSVMVLGRNIGFECKNYSNAHVKEWWEQAEKLEVLGREPVVVYKLRGESLEDVKAIIRLDTLLELIKRQSDKPEQDTLLSNEDRRLKWALEQMIRSAKEVIKLTE